MNTEAEFWEHIESNFPNALEELDKIDGGNITPDGRRIIYLNHQDYFPFVTRDLYDHFDGLGIIIEVYRASIVHSGNEISSTEEEWSEWKWASKIDAYGEASWRDTRIEAETAAFTKCFEIRETQLGEEQLNK